MLTSALEAFNLYTQIPDKDQTVLEKIQQTMPTIHKLLDFLSGQQMDAEDMNEMDAEDMKESEPELEQAKDDNDRLSAARYLVEFVNQVDSDHATLETTKKPIKEASIKRQIRRQKQKQRDMLKKLR
jgi:hypothetical protein